MADPHIWSGKTKRRLGRFVVTRRACLLSTCAAGVHRLGLRQANTRPRLAEAVVCPYNKAMEGPLSTIARGQPDNATTTAVHPEKPGPLTRLAFGVGDLGPAIVSGINGFFLNASLLDVAVRACPITRERHRQIRAELQRRNAGARIS
jgi:hypothetical protein